MRQQGIAEPACPENLAASPASPASWLRSLVCLLAFAVGKMGVTVRLFFGKCRGRGYVNLILQGVQGCDSEAGIGSHQPYSQSAHDEPDSVSVSASDRQGWTPVLNCMYQALEGSGCELCSKSSPGKAVHLLTPNLCIRLPECVS